MISEVAMSEGPRSVRAPSAGNARGSMRGRLNYETVGYRRVATYLRRAAVMPRDAEAELWFGVLVQVVIDLDQSLQFVPDLHRGTARAFMATPRFDRLCRLFELDADMVRQSIGLINQPVAELVDADLLAVCKQWPKWSDADKGRWRSQFERPEGDDSDDSLPVWLPDAGIEAVAYA